MLELYELLWSPYGVELLVCSVLLITSTVVVPIILTKKLKRGKSWDPVRVTVTLLFVTPIVILCLMLLGVHEGRMKSLEALTSSNADMVEQFVYFAKGAAAASYLKSFGGLFLILSGATCAGCFIFISMTRRRKNVSLRPLASVAGIGAASLVLGIGLVLKESSAESNWHAMTHYYSDNRLEVLTSVINRTDSMSVILVITLIVVIVAGLMIVIPWQKNRRTTEGIERAVLVSGLVVLATGILAFASTRKHSMDFSQSIPKMIPKAEESCWFDQSEVTSPRLLNHQRVDCSPIISISPGKVEIYGMPVLRKEVSLSNEGDEVFKLSDSLEKIKKQFLKFNPDKKSPGPMLLEADVKMPCTVIAKILTLCHRIGYREIRIATTWIDVLDTVTFGRLGFVKGAGLPFTITEGEETGSLTLNPDETFGQFAERVDQAATKGPVLVRLEQ